MWRIESRIAYRPFDARNLYWHPETKLLDEKREDLFGACWKDIPAQVWNFTIGGYQVIKKWLSYREFELLGRPLTPDEAREVTHMARRIAALILLQPELDQNYRAVKSASATWSDFATASK